MTQKKKSKNERKLEKELLYFLGFFLFLIIVFLVASSFFKSFNTFEYEGLTFTKEKLGEIPIFHYYYFFNNKNNDLIKYNLYLRIDPRENEVPVEKSEDISMNNGKVVFVSVESTNTLLTSCPYSVLGVANLASFLRDNDFVVEGANLDFHDAKAKKEKWVTCETHIYNPVIEIKEGDETKINILGNCYEISVSSCDGLLPAIEMFELQTIMDAKKRDSSK